MSEINDLRQELSALMDGELDPARLDAVLGALEKHPELLAEVQTWQSAGDALRQATPVTTTFFDRFSERLAQEPVQLNHRRLPHLRRTLLPLALAASVSFVVFSAWQGLWSSEPEWVAERQERTVKPYLSAHLQDADNPLSDGAVIKVAFEPGENR